MWQKILRFISNKTNIRVAGEIAIGLGLGFLVGSEFVKDGEVKAEEEVIINPGETKTEVVE